MNLIKKHRPKYNIRLKDDKRYPYIKVHWADPFPKVTVTRQMIDDGSRYFGPYTSAWAVYQTLDVLRRIRSGGPDRDAQRRIAPAALPSVAVSSSQPSRRT